MPSDIKEFETVFAYSEKEGELPRDIGRGIMCGSNVDGLRAKKRANFIQEHSLEGLNTEGKLSKVKQILNTLRNKSIQDRKDAREKHNAKVREGNYKGRRKQRRKQRKEQERMKTGRSILRGVEKATRKMWRGERG